MNGKILHTILLAVIGLLLIGLLAGTYGINKVLSSEASKLTAAKAKSQALEQEQIGLKKAKKDIQKYAELEQIAKAVVPEDKSQAEAVREIVNIAAANNIGLASVNFPASTLGNNLLKTGSATASPSPAAGANTKSLSQLLPVKNIAGVYELTITVNSDPNNPVQYSRFINFLKALESNRRTAQVSSIAIQPNLKNHSLLSFNLTLNEYIKP